VTPSLRCHERWSHHVRKQGPAGPPCDRHPRDRHDRRSSRLARRRRRPTAIETLERRRDELDAELDALIAAPIPEAREAAVEAAETITRRTEMRQDVEERIRLAREQETRRQAAADAAEQLAAGSAPDRQPRAIITSEPRTYGEDMTHSYFLDLARSQLKYGDGDGGVDAANERLARHAKELEVDLPAREARATKSPQRHRPDAA
jgi:hypothetical protein